MNVIYIYNFIFLLESTPVLMYAVGPSLRLCFFMCPLFIQVGVQTAVRQGFGLPWSQSHAFLNRLQHPPVQL